MIIRRLLGRFGYIHKSSVDAMLAAERLGESFKHDNAYVRDQQGYGKWSHERCGQLLKDFESKSNTAYGPLEK